MRIYNRIEFMKLPEGTVFAKGERWCWESLHFKGETIGSPEPIDWWEINPCWIDADSSDQAWERFEEMESKGASYPMEDCSGRDGCFGNEDLFLVFEKEDLIKLKEWIEKAIDQEEDQLPIRKEEWDKLGKEATKVAKKGDGK